MSKAQAQVCYRRTAPNLPQSASGDIAGGAGAGALGKCESALNFMTPVGVLSTDKIAPFERPYSNSILLHKTRITSVDVDTMWMSMYESNQPSNNHNRV